MRRTIAVGAVVVAMANTACSTLLGAEPTPVPGAAATLTRSINTPIPTPVRTPSAVPSASPSRLAVAVSPGPSPAATRPGPSDEDVSRLQRRMEQAVSTADLPGVESLLLDHISLSTPDGGRVLDGSQAAAWLRDHAGPGIKVTRLDRGTQTLMLQVLTEGWPSQDPIQRGEVSFSLRRYDANGRPDEEGGGDWKIDVIEAE